MLLLAEKLVISGVCGLAAAGTASVLLRLLQNARQPRRSSRQAGRLPTSPRGEAFARGLIPALMLVAAALGASSALVWISPLASAVPMLTVMASGFIWAGALRSRYAGTQLPAAQIQSIGGAPEPGLPPSELPPDAAKVSGPTQRPGLYSTKSRTSAGFLPGQATPVFRPITGRLLLFSWLISLILTWLIFR